jgi:Methyltransferase domain
MSFGTLPPNSAECNVPPCISLVSHNVSRNCTPFGPRTKRRINLASLADGLRGASNFYHRGNPLDAFDVYEQLAASNPGQSIEILAELYDLYQALPDKEDRYALYQARLFDFGIRPSDKVLGVGSGNVPFPLATHLADLAPHDDHYGRAGVPFKQVQGKPVYICDIENMDSFTDKEFDFVYCSHVLEHVRNPERACNSCESESAAKVRLYQSSQECLAFSERRDQYF